MHVSTFLDKYKEKRHGWTKASERMGVFTFSVCRYRERIGRTVIFLSVSLAVGIIVFVSIAL
jgi:hypothetical protein